MKNRVKSIFNFIFVILSILAMVVIANVKNETNKKLAYLNSPEVLRSVNYPEVQPGDEKVDGCDNKVNFSAYFTKDIDGDGRAEKLYGSCQSIGSTSQLFIDVNIDGDGHIEDGVITIDGQNFSLAMNMLKDNLLKNNVVSEDVRSIELNNVVSGNSEVLIGAISSRIRDVDSYTKVNHVTLTGTYVPDEEDATPVQINKTIDLTVDWYGSTRAYVHDGISKYSRTAYVHDESQPNDDEKVQTVTFNFEVMEVAEQLIPKSQQVEVLIPKCVGDDPVNVTTNGEYSYDPETRILTITKNTSQRVVPYAIDVQYKQSSLNKLKWEDTGYSLVASVKATVTCYNNENEEFENPTTSEVVTGEPVVRFIVYPPAKIEADYTFSTSISTYETRGKRKIISKQNIYDQYNTDEELDNIPYATSWRVTKNSRSNVTAKVNMYDDFYGDFINGTNMKDYIKYTGISISNSSFIPDNEKISIYNRDTNELIAEFYGSELNGYKRINFGENEDIRGIRISVSQSSRCGTLDITNFKVLETKKIQEDYTLSQVMNMTDLGTKMEGGCTPSCTTDVTGIDYVDLVGNASDMEVRLSKSVITSMDILENELISISLPRTGASNGWKDGIFLVEIPKGVAKIKVNSITANDSNVEILGYDVYGQGGKQFIKVVTSNVNASNYDLRIDCDLIPDPRTPSGAITVTAYGYNPESSVYWNSTRDIYDINGDGDKAEAIGYATAGMNMMASSTFITTETISDYNESEDITIAPNVALIDNNINSAKVNVTVLNNYDKSVKNVVILGKIPFEGNTYVDSENALRSTFTATMKDTGIIVPNSIKDKTTVYYTSVATPTKDLNDAANGWKAADEWTSLEDVKNYLIVIDKTFSRRESYEFSYEVSIPEDLASNNAAYSCHKAYFDLITSEGDVDLSVQPSKVGVRVVKPFSFELTKYKRATNLALNGAVFKISEDVPAGEEDNARILITDYRGKFTIDNLVVNQVYKIEEIKAPNHFELNDGVIKFKVVENTPGVFEFVDVSDDKFDGTPTVTTDAHGKPTLKATIEDEPKFRLNITKIDGESGDTIPGIKFRLNNDKTYKTMSTGVIHIDDLVVGEDYSLEEIEASGYYIIEDTIDFKIVKNQDDTYSFITNSEYIPEIPTIVYDDSTTYIDVDIRITNTKMPRFNLKVLKVEEGNESNKLADAQYRLITVDDDKTAYYTTDENGEISVPELIQKNNLSSRTGKYKLKEEQEPYGYTLNNEEIEFYVEKNANNQLEVHVTDEENLTSLKDIRVEEDTVTLVVEDRPLFRLIKTDKSTGLPLANAEFTINEVDSTSGTIGDYAKDVYGNYIGELNDNGMYVIKTDENGVLTAPLTDGTYKIVEVEFPEGYEEKTNAEMITISGGRGPASEVAPLPEVTMEDTTTEVLEINYIEDLVRLSNKINNGETRYADTKVVLKRTLDFKEADSYENPDDTSFGDVNKDGTVEGIKSELDSPKGLGFPQIGKKDPNNTDMSIATPAGRFFCFAGVFDGQGHELRNIYIKCASEDENVYNHGGLFRTIYDAKFINFGITGKIEFSGNYFGGIVGSSVSAYMENCYTKCDMEALDTSNNHCYVGGLIGICYGDTYLNNCHSEGNITGACYEVGGLIGQISNNGSGDDNYVIINNCYNVGNIIGTKNAEYYGGCAGNIYTSSDLYIYNSYNEGDIDCTAIPISNSKSELGGVVGYITCSKNAYADRCYNTGDVLCGAQAYLIGGVFGIYSANQSGKITNCYNTGTVSNPSVNSSYYEVGGIVGQIGSKIPIENCYNSGHVIGDEQVGGIVGNADGLVQQCYNTGKIDGRYRVGGIVGYSNNNITIKKCYNTGNVNLARSEEMVGYGDYHFGGILGECYRYYIEDCYNTGDITQYETREGYAAGILASGSKGTIMRCYNQGNIRVTPYSQGSLNIFCVGGIVCYAGSESTIVKCSNSGNISITDSTGQSFGSGIYAAGIARQGIITDSYNTGNINVDVIYPNGGMYIGGIASSGTVTTSYNTGDITVNARATAAGIYIGGIASCTNNNSNYVACCYNTGDITFKTPSVGWIYAGGVGGSIPCRTCYNTGDVNIDVGSYTGSDSHYVGGICGNSTVTNSYNIGNVYNKVANPDVYHTRTSPITNTDDASGSGNNGFYQEGIQVVGRNVSAGYDRAPQTWEVKLSESVMKSEEFKQYLGTGAWVYSDGNYPTFNIALSAPGQKISRLEMTNTKKQYDVVIGIDKNSKGLAVGGDTSGEYTDAYPDTGLVKWVDTVEYNQACEEDIVITPSENYMITKITVNGEEIPFVAANDGTYTFESGYFSNITEFTKIMVTFEEKTSVLKIKKTDADGNPLKDAKFKIEQVENRTVLPDSSVIGNVSGTGPIYSKIDTTNVVNDSLGAMTKPDNVTYGFTEVSTGKYESTNTNVNSSISLSYMELDLTGKTGKYVVVVNAKVSSQNNYDWGYAAIRTNTDINPSHSGTQLRFIHISGLSGTDTDYTSAQLMGGNKYYIYFGYQKNASTNSGDDKFTINSVNVYGVIENKYGFTQDNGTYTSTNQGKENTTCTSRVSINLSEFTGRYKVIMNTDLSSKSNVDSATLSLAGYIDRKYEYAQTGTTSDGEYYFIVNGGRSYNLTMSYSRGAGTADDHGTDTFTVSNIRFELDDSDFYTGTDLTTNENGEYTAILTQGKYIVTETEAPEGYILNDTPQEVILPGVEDSVLTFENQSLKCVTAHYYLYGTGPEFAEEGQEAPEPVMVAADKRYFGAPGDDYRTQPLLFIGDYTLIKNANNEYVIPDNATGVFGDEDIDVYYYYLGIMADYNVHYLYSNVEDRDAMETEKSVVGSEIRDYEDKSKDGYTLDRVENIPLIVDEESYKNNIYVYYETDELNYEVHYFYEQADGVFEEDEEIAELENTAAFGSEISSYEEKNKDGYKFKSAKALDENGDEGELPLIIKSEEEKNIINVYYEKDTFEYTVHYFYDNEEDTSKIEILNAKFGDSINTYPTEGKCPEGYALKEAKALNDNGEETALPLVIKSDVNKNVINVYYVRMYDITTDITEKTETKHDGTTTSNVKGGTISGEDETPYESVQRGEANTKAIAVEANEGYVIKDIKVNGTAIDYSSYVQRSAAHKVVLPEGYFTNIQENKNVTAEFDKVSNVKVRYMVVDTDTKLAEDIDIPGVAGDSFSTEYKTFTGYKLNSIKDQDGTVLTGTNNVISGNMYADELVVTYWYDIDNSSITEEHILINEDSSTQTLETQGHEGQVGTSETLNRKTYTNYEAAEGPASQDQNVIVVGKTENSKEVEYASNVTKTVRFYYGRKDAKVTVHYVEKATNTEIDEVTEIPGKAGRHYTTSPKTIANYVLLEGEDYPTNAEGDFAPGNIDVYYYYKKAQSKITEKHIDITTGEEVIIETHEYTQDVTTTKTFNRLTNDNYVAADGPEGTELIIVVGKTENTKTVTFEQNKEKEVRFYYVKAQATLTEKHIDLTTGEEIEISSNTYTQNVGTSKTLNRLTDVNYVAADGPESQDENVIVVAKTENSREVTFEANKNKEVRFYYVKAQATLTEKHIDLTTGEEIEISSNTYTQNVGTSKTLNRLTDVNYVAADGPESQDENVIVVAKTENSKEITFEANKNKEVRFYYVKAQAKITEKHIDITSGSEVIIEEHEYTESVGTSKTFNRLTNNNYVGADAPADVPERIIVVGKTETSKELTFEVNNDKEIRFYYVKAETIIRERHIDITTGEEVEISSENHTGIVGTSITLNRLTGDKYKAVAGPEITEPNVIVAGESDTSITEEYEADVIKEVRFYYVKNVGKVIVEYVDNITGDKVKNDTIIEKYIDDTYEVTRETIPGYKLDEEHLPTNETGIIKKDPQTVTYTYIELRPYELIVRYTVENGDNDQAKFMVKYGDTQINDYTTNGTLKIADIELTDLEKVTYTVYETETPEFCDPVITEEHPAVVELEGTLNTDANKYEYVANYEKITGFNVIIDEENKKVIFDVTTSKDVKFDLAIQKFVSAINGVKLTEREPKAQVVDGKVTYTKDNEIVKTENNQNVTYTVRVYNESENAAFGKKIIEYIPEGLVFVPENETNKEFGWKMYKIGADDKYVETTDVNEAVIVATDYIEGTRIESANLSEGIVNYLDLNVVFKVDESKLANHDRIIENNVRIIKNDNDENTDNDVTTEKLYVKYFDLEIEKYIEKIKVEENDDIREETIGYARKGELVKVDIKRSNINRSKITVTYGMKVTNVGEIAGKATELEDYMPEGFKLVEDGIWTVDGNRCITDTLSDVVIEPGESKDIYVTFEWKVSEDTIGLKSNEAHISKYENEFDAKDLTEDNRGKQDMLVSIKTGSEVISYVAIVLSLTIIISAGVAIIKKRSTKDNK